MIIGTISISSHYTVFIQLPHVYIYILPNLANKHGPTKTRKQRVTSVKTGCWYPVSVFTQATESAAAPHRWHYDWLHSRVRRNRAARTRRTKRPDPMELEDFTPLGGGTVGCWNHQHHWKTGVFFLHLQNGGWDWDWDELKHQLGTTASNDCSFVLFCFQSLIMPGNVVFFCWGFNAVVGKQRVNKVHFSATTVQMITNKSHRNICNSWNWDGLSATFEIDLRYWLPTIQEVVVVIMM